MMDLEPQIRTLWEMNALITYDVILECIGFRWFTTKSDDCEGDMVTVLDGVWDPSRGRCWGLSIFGFGSCSGCDALSAALDEGLDAVVKLAMDLQKNVKTFRTLGEVADYLENDDIPQFWTGGLEARQMIAVIRAFEGVKP